MHRAVVPQLQRRSPTTASPAGRAVHAQFEHNGQGLAESGTIGDSGLDLGVIIHLWCSATEHVRFHLGGLSVWHLQVGHNASCFTCPLPGVFFGLNAP